MSDVPKDYYLGPHGEELLIYRFKPNLDLVRPPRKQGRRKIKAGLNVRSKLAERDSNACHYCGLRMEIRHYAGQPRKDDATIEHVVPRALGGSNALDNLVLACYQCNNDRGIEENYCECNFCLSAYAMFNNPLTHPRNLC